MMNRTKHLNLMNVVTGSACFLFAVCFSSSCDGESVKNLAPFSQYKIKYEGYLYPGQFAEGANIKAKKPGYYSTPRMELNDVTGKLLIDGKSRRAIYSSFWSGQAKRATITFHLAGKSLLSHVTVKQKGVDKMTALIRTSPGKWREWDMGKKEECDQVRFVFIQKRKAQFCIKEIEIHGIGPIKAQKRGLIRSKPHIKTVSKLKSTPSKNSTLITSIPKCRVKVKKGKRFLLDEQKIFDGDFKATAFSIPKSVHRTECSLIVDLGKTESIDCIEIWFPDNLKNYLNEIEIFVSNEATKGFFPVERLINPYWPFDKLATPYTLVANNVNLRGRYIRIDLLKVNHITKGISISEIRVWSKTAK